MKCFFGLDRETVPHRFRLRKTLAYILKRKNWDRTEYLAATYKPEHFGSRSKQRLALRIGERAIAVKWATLLNEREARRIHGRSDRSGFAMWSPVRTSPWRVVTLVRTAA